MVKKIPPQTVAAPGRGERHNDPDDHGVQEPLSGSKKGEKIVSTAGPITEKAARHMLFGTGL